MLVGVSLVAQTHRTIEPRVFGGFTVGAELAKLANDSGATFSQTPWFAGALDLGVSFTYRDRLGVALQGSGTLNGYQYSGNNVDYDVYSVLWRTETRAWLLARKTNKAGSRLRIGCGLGLSLNTADTLEYSEPGFQAISVKQRKTSTYVAPEIGFTKDIGRHQLDFCLRYLYHVQRTPSLSTLLIAPGASALATATNDQLNLVLRFHFGFKQRPRVPPAMPAIDYATRTTDTLTTVHTRNARITLRLWDDAEYDGDTVSVFLNDVPVLTALELTARKQVLRLQLREGANTVLVVSHNEGRVPPNTARCKLRGVPGVPELRIKTSTKRNEAVIIQRE